MAMKLQYTVNCLFAYSSDMRDFTGFDRGGHEHKLMFDVSTYVSMVSNGHDREKQGVECTQVERAMLNIRSLLGVSLRIYDQIQLVLFVQALGINKVAEHYIDMHCTVMNMKVRKTRNKDQVPREKPSTPNTHSLTHTHTITISVQEFGAFDIEKYHLCSQKSQ